MRKIPALLLTLATVFTLAVASTRPAVAGAQDFRLYNRTGVDIYAVYISPTGEEEWQENVMDGDVLLNGADILIKFSPGSEVQFWDIRIEDEDENYLFWEEIDLLSAYEVILNADGTARIKE